MHEEYVARKFGKAYEYLHPKMEKFLSKTYGVLLYQEQTTQCAVDMAGFTPTEADHFRKGIKLKDPKKFAVWKDKFISGCQDHSDTSIELAEQIWQFVEFFSGYGFNLSHGSSYAVLAFITAYLKVYYPLEFMMALLTSAAGEDKKLLTYVKETKRMGIKILSPKINKSSYHFMISGKSILYPFTAVKQCGVKAIDAIVSERKKNGRFEDFMDFYKRVDKRVVNVGVMTNLILANCFREFGKIEDVFDQMIEIRGKDPVCRSLYCKDCMLRYPISVKRTEIAEDGVVCPNCGDTNIILKDHKTQGRKFDNRYIKRLVFGFYLNDNPLRPYMARIMQMNIDSMNAVQAVSDGTCITFPACVTKIKKHIDKNQNEMAFIDITDGTFEASLTVFAKQWAKINKLIVAGNCFVFKGEKNRGDNFLLSRASDSVVRL